MTERKRRSFKPKFHPSFVDESLFGTRRATREREEPCKEFDPPWVNKKVSKKRAERPLLFYCPQSTSLATAESSKQQPLATAVKVQTPESKSRASTARARTPRMKFSPTYVDESLFKSTHEKDAPVDFDPPWVQTPSKGSRPVLFDYSGSRPSSCPPQRPGSSKSERNDRTEWMRVRQGDGNRRNIMDNRRPWR